MNNKKETKFGNYRFTGLQAVITSPYAVHLHFNYKHPAEIQKLLADQIQSMAGEFFGQAKYEEAERYRKAAEVLREIEIQGAEFWHPYPSVEISYELLTELIEEYEQIKKNRA